MNNIEIITNFPKDQEFKETKQNYLQEFSNALKALDPRINEFTASIIRAKYLISTTQDYALHSWVIDFNIILTTDALQLIRKQLEKDLAGIIDADAFSIINSCSLSSKLGTQILINCIENF